MAAEPAYRDDDTRQLTKLGQDLLKSRNILFVGFLVSAEVFRDIRIPFTSHVLRSRPVEG